MYKNIAKETRLCLADLVDYSAGQVVSKTLVQNEKVSMTIFSLIRARRSLPIPPAATPW